MIICSSRIIKTASEGNITCIEFDSPTPGSDVTEFSDLEALRPHILSHPRVLLRVYLCMTNFELHGYYNST